MNSQLTPQDIVDNATRLVIKIGTSSIIDETNKNDCFFKHIWLDDFLKSCIKLNRDFNIVSSGAIGMARIQRHGTRPQNTAERQAFAGEGQPSLYHKYQDILSRLDKRTAQVLLTATDLTREPGLSNTRDTLNAYRSLGTIYIANENDTVATDEIKIGDNDKLSALTAVADKADTLILITDINGLYTSDPRRNPQADHIQMVDALTENILKMAGGSNGHQGTGGMVTKLQAARIAAEQGINTIIVNGEKPDCLTRLFNGEFAHATFIPHTAHPQLGLF